MNTNTDTVFIFLLLLKWILTSAKFKESVCRGGDTPAHILIQCCLVSDSQSGTLSHFAPVMTWPQRPGEQRLWFVTRLPQYSRRKPHVELLLQVPLKWLCLCECMLLSSLPWQAVFFRKSAEHLFTPTVKKEQYLWLILLNTKTPTLNSLGPQWSREHRTLDILQVC